MAPSPTPSKSSRTSLDHVQFTRIPGSEPTTSTTTPATTTATAGSGGATAAPITVVDMTATEHSPTSPQTCVDQPLAVTSQLEAAATATTAGKTQGKPNASPGGGRGGGCCGGRVTPGSVAFCLVITLITVVIVCAVLAVTIAFVIDNGDGSSERISMDNTSNHITPSASALTTATTATSATPATTTSSPTTTQQPFTLPPCTVDKPHRCPSGQCLTNASVCNKLYECPDFSDEANCPECVGFQCATTQVCLWDIGRRCDGVIECTDLSDEMECPTSPSHRLCDNGVRVWLADWCNGLDDCRDNSDEKNCECPRHMTSCGETSGRCIPRSLKCDGHVDCQNGTDEIGCPQCTDTEFQCTDYTCIPGTKRCDGHTDCTKDGADESGCFQTEPESHRLRILSKGMWVPVCSEGWTQAHSQAYCRTHHKREVVSWGMPDSGEASSFAVLIAGSTNNHNSQDGGSGGDGSRPGDFHIRSTCQTGKGVAIQCQDTTCGERKRSVLQNAIAGGKLAPLGKWPWVASLAYRGSPVCGAVILNENWVMTAFHCVMKHYSEHWTNTSNPPHHFTITYGSIISTNTTTTTIDNAPSSTSTDPLSHPLPNNVRYVSRIRPHAQSAIHRNEAVDWDMALLRLASPISLSDVAQPLCLPPPHSVLAQTAVCYVAGWGMLSEKQYLKPSRLRETRLRVWSEARCRSKTEAEEGPVNTNHTICAGFYYGRPSSCQGDSGSPLMCLDASSSSSSSHGSPRWFLAGVLSRTSWLCGTLKPGALANRFARVSTSVDWVVDTIRDGDG